METARELNSTSGPGRAGRQLALALALLCGAALATAGPHGGGHAGSGGGAPGHASPAPMHMAAAPSYHAPVWRGGYTASSTHGPAYPAAHPFIAPHSAAGGGARRASTTPAGGGASFIHASYQPGHDGGGHNGGGHSGAGHGGGAPAGGPVGPPPAGHPAVAGGHPGFAGDHPGYGPPHPGYGGSHPGFASNQGIEVHHGGGHYWYHGGYWYRPGGGGWIITGPPYGAFVPWLPWGYTSFWYGGFPYYYYNNVYYAYRDQDRGYEVVEPPPGAEAAVAQADNLYVYPKNGQSAEQQATDRYECHRWAGEQTGFDPTQTGGGVPDDQTAQRRADYLRAMTSCLEGRGYSVR